MYKLLFLLIIFMGTAVAAESEYESDTTVYADRAEFITPDPDGIVTNVLLTFIFYDTWEEFWAAFPDDPDAIAFVLDGISYCERNIEQNIAWCEIHQVRPRIVDGENTLTVGHEVEHGIFGPEYHE